MGNGKPITHLLLMLEKRSIVTAVISLLKNVLAEDKVTPTR
jgi:hypothetical protein